MDRQRLVWRVSLWAVCCGILVRLITGGAFASVTGVLAEPETLSFLMYLQTGRILRTVPPEPTEPMETTRPEETEEATQPAQVPVISPTDAAFVAVQSTCGIQPDVQALLCQDLQWDLTQPQPTVLILHSHATESYENEGLYAESAPYRTLDTQFNMVAIGREVKNILEAAGIGVIHAENLHDYPSYNDAYGNSRQTAVQILAENPQIQLVLDLHRDAVQAESGQQLGSTVTVEGEPAAKLMLVVGSDVSGQSHPGWQNNLALAVKLHARLQSRYPGICRNISFRSQRFNQDLSAGALLVEVGAAGNTRQEALAAARCLANCIIELSQGVQILEAA